ncbi:hypothetical protein J2W43_000553 [Pseudomonas brassicacearum]|uniref:Transcriptional regulator n=1 Tax=Pseudomonas brassicacearum TaxID=930166 RepID=A0AAW8M4E5_9PSED|nr:hypothetical protein [Pseudomonas brassicacearum]MDR6956590.1 hypothetical protein [Pseudomonas brassicacearum]
MAVNNDMLMEQQDGIEHVELGELSSLERTLVMAFRNLSDKDKRSILRYLEALIHSPE